MGTQMEGGTAGSLKGSTTMGTRVRRGLRLRVQFVVRVHSQMQRQTALRLEDTITVKARAQRLHLGFLIDHEMLTQMKGQATFRREHTTTVLTRTYGLTLEWLDFGVGAHMQCQATLRRELPRASVARVSARVARRSGAAVHAAHARRGTGHTEMPGTGIGRRRRWRRSVVVVNNAAHHHVVVRIVGDGHRGTVGVVAKHRTGHAWYAR